MDYLLIFLPGNPSVPEIYDDFLFEIVDGHKNIEVKTLNHLGQSRETVSLKRKIDLSDVISHHKKNIREILEKNKNHKIVLVGHSLGCTIGIEIYKEFQLRIEKVIMICPFLGPSLNNDKFLKAFERKVSRNAIFALMAGVLINKRVGSLFFRIWLGKNKKNAHILKNVRKQNFIANFVSLLSSYRKEFSSLDIESKIDLLEKKKTHFIFAKEDFWVPAEVEKKLSLKFNCEVIDGISHDFCLSSEETKKIATRVKRYLEI